MRKILLFFSLILLSCISFGQQKNLDRAEEAIVDSFYERAYKLTLEAIEDEVTSKDALSYYLNAICIYHLSKESFFIKKNPDAIKDACKQIKRAKKKDKDGKYEGRFDEFIADLVKANNEIAKQQYSVNRFSKAVKLYDMSYELNGDTTAFYMIGRSYQMDLDTVLAKYYYKELVNIYNEVHKSGNSIKELYVEPFLFLADVHWLKKNYDSANYYLEVGRSIFGESQPRINFYQYMIAKDQIANQPPSSLMMDVIQKALIYSPSDTFLIKKENALALYLIRNAIDAKGFKEADTLINRFARRKAIKANDKSYDELKEIDIFLQPFEENVIWKLADYFYINTHDKAAAYLAKVYILKTASSNDTIRPTEKDIINRWVKIIDFAQKNETAGFVALLLNQSLADYPKSKELLALKKKPLKK